MNDEVDKGRLLAGDRSISQKIRNRLQQLDNATKIDKQRWIWELLQNAKDSILGIGKVDIKIIIDNDYVDFTHNGGFFTSENIISLVSQLSSKEGTDSTGRFGTGFLTTHTLSRLTQVEGILLEEKINQYSSFSILLNREGKNEKDFIEGIAKTWKSRKTTKIKKPDIFYTSFKYLKPNKEIALGALETLEESILFNLAFVEKLGKLTIKNNIENIEYDFYMKDKKELTQNLYLYTFMAKGKERFLLKLSNENIDICIEVFIQNNQYIFRQINKKLPRLFSDFPLVGTEKFSFPLVLNSRKFSPKTERDGLYLNGDGEFAINNKELIKEAVDLYWDLLDFTTKNNFKDFHIIAKHTLPPKNNDFDQNWYKDEIQVKIQNALLEFPIVKSENNNLHYLLKGTSDEGIIGVWFPYASDEKTRKFIWDKTFALYPNSLPLEKDINHWFEIIKEWKRCNRQELNTLIRDIETFKNISNLKEHLKIDENKSLEWLNDTCNFIQNKEENLLDTSSILANQYGTLKKKSELYYDANIPNELKDILKLNDIDIQEELLHNDLSKIDMGNRKKTIKTVLNVIHKIIEDDDKSDEVRSIVFKLLGYSSSYEIDTKHKTLWTFARTLYLDEIPEKIQVIKNIENEYLHKESFKWLITQMLKDIAKKETLANLGKNLFGQHITTQWLNNLIAFILENKEFKNIILDEYIIFPNQYGIFKEKSELYYDNNIPNELKDVLKLNNIDIREELLHNDLFKVYIKNRRKTIKTVLDNINEIIENNDKYAEVRNTVFRLLGYSSSFEIDKKHQELWEFARTLYLDQIPEKINFIRNIHNENIHKESFKWLIIQIAKDITKTKNINNLEKVLFGTTEPIKWLNNLISFIEEDKEFKHIIDLDEYIILPNQEGNFSSKSELFLDNELDETLKEVLLGLNPAWIGELLNIRIFLKLPESRVRNFEDITKEIDDSFRKYSGDKQNPEFIQAFRKLLSWTDKYKSQFEEYFNWVYSNKAELSLSILGNEKEKDEIFDIIQSGNAPLLSKLANSLSHNDLEKLAENPEEFKKFMEYKESGKNIEEKDTEDALIEKMNELMGENFSSLEDMKNKYHKRKIEKNISIEDMENHSLTDRELTAIKNSNEEAKSVIKEHLSKNDSYDVSEWEGKEQSKTIIVGVKKKGIAITLVVKGANNGTAYFDNAGKEKSILKNSFTELWVHSRGHIIPVTIGRFIEDYKIKVMDI